MILPNEPEPTKRDEKRRGRKLSLIELAVVDGLNSKQCAALLHLLSGASLTVCAVSCNTSRQTLSGWCNNPGPFKTALENARKQLRDEMAGRVICAADKALDTLLDLCDSKDDRIALDAARALLARVPVDADDRITEVCFVGTSPLRQMMADLDAAADEDAPGSDGGN